VKPYSVQTFTAFPLVIREQDGAQLSELRRRILERGEQNSALVDREPEQFTPSAGAPSSEGRPIRRYRRKSACGKRTAYTFGGCCGAWQRLRLRAGRRGLLDVDHP
jgi:hypothetical protein